MMAGMTAREGTSSSVSTITMVTGDLIEGTVVDAATGQPLPDAMIMNNGLHRPAGIGGLRAVTDQAGRYSFRVLPGQNSVFVQVAPRGYVVPVEASFRKPRKVVVTQGKAARVPFRLNRALTLIGVAVDQAGKPLANLEIQAGANREYSIEKTDAQGKWSLEGLKPGRVQVMVPRQWQVVGSNQTTLPRSQPLRLVLRRANVKAVTARVTTPGGRPVVGAHVTAQIDTYKDQKRSWPPLDMRQEKTVSGTDGRFSVRDLADNDAVVRVLVEKKNHVYVSGGVTKKGNAYIVSDFVLAPLTGRVAGRVLDADGQPAAGARVGAIGLLDAVSADAQGRFSLQSLPEGEVELLAFGNGGWAQATTRAVDNVTQDIALKLSPSRALAERDGERAYVILADVLKQSEGAKYYGRSELAYTLAPFDLESAEKLRRETGDAGSLQLYRFLPTLAQLDAGRAAQLVPRIDAMQNPSDRIYTWSRVGLMLADTNREVAQSLYIKAAAALKAQGLMPPPGDEYMGVFNYASTAALAARLGHTEAEALSDTALIVAERAYRNPPVNERQPKIGDADYKPTLDIMITLAAGVLARGSATLVERAAGELPAGLQMRALCDAVQELASYDVPGALRLLDKIGAAATSGKEAPSGPPQKASDERRPEDNPTYAFGKAALPVIEAIQKSDADGALALARRVRSTEHRPLALALAAQAQDSEAATQLFGEAFAAADSVGWSMSFSSRGVHTRIAAMAYDKVPALGRRLFTDLKARLARLRPDESIDAAPPQNFAFYYARVDPLESRLLLEREWGKQVERYEKSDTVISWRGAEYALAMAVLDVERALEMVRQLRDERDRFEGQRKIAQYVLASDEVRRTLVFNRWANSSTWTPGTTGED
jgi:hypothetical protein